MLTDAPDFETLHDADPIAARSRDSANTQRLLLQAARRRFARDGYSATTVRDIATDAGVNVALINRYFLSKEGLFEACLTDVGEQLSKTKATESTVKSLVASIVGRLEGTDSDQYPLQLMLLLRTSGDTRAEEIRRGILQSFAEGIASVAGWRPGVPDTGKLLLRAEIALATAMGIVLLRSSGGLEPLASASGDDFAEVLGSHLEVLLAP